MTQPRELIRLAEVKRRTGLPTTTIYRLVAAGKFPRQVKLADRISAWAVERGQRLDRGAHRRALELTSISC
jgi:predicted DNA-binding transcriptional regulator AlpA